MLLRTELQTKQSIGDRTDSFIGDETGMEVRKAMETDTDILKVEHLYKSFGRFQLEDISFSLPKGYILGVIGENGAGKSTLIRCMMNIYRKEKGQVTGAGFSLDENEAEMKRHIAVVLDQPMYEENMTCIGNAKLLKCIDDRFSMEQFLQEMQQWDVPVKKRMCELSKGMQMKFQISMAMAQNPDLLIMDEPAANLDEASRTKFKERMLEFVNDGTKSILISSHQTKLLEQVADYIMYLHRGKVLLYNDKERVLEEYMLVSGEKYKIKLIPGKYLIGMEEENLSTKALIQKSRQYVPDVALTTCRPTLADIMYYFNQREIRG